MAVYEEGYAPAADAPRLSNLANYAGAVVSLALILGVAFWGYQLIMRDVSGIPVVRAIEGDMRVLPDNPGGAIAPHVGLSVNEVAAVGEAGGPEDRLVLAPRTPGLAPEDLAALPDVPTPQVDVAETVAQDDVAALAAELANLSAATETPEVMPDAAVATPTEAEVTVISPSVPGVSTSLRPIMRPARLSVGSAAQRPAVTSGAEVAVTTTPFPAGTNLVQLGAFQSPTLAAAEWRRLQDRFGQVMADRSRVIQVSNQSSGTWYRLRASGFADRAEAQRLCAALQAEGAECIAVVTN
ncbi:MAG: SPOR domain-containing protein [Pseudomonadota bacterium]